MPSRNLDDACSFLREAIPLVLDTYNSYFDRYQLRATVGDVLRTLQEQQEAYAKGRTAPGKIVTHADGINKLSNHQAQLAHGETCSHAVDIAVFGDGGTRYVGDGKGDERWYCPLIGLGLAHGLKSGGMWERPDLPHLYCVVVED